MSARSQEWARRYIGLGYAPIPVPSGSKNPNRSGWQDERLTLEDVPRCWNNGQNVGLLTGAPSRWLVDVDLDVPEAVALAGRFLNPTRTSGHGENLESHWWYSCEGAETKEYRDTDGKKKLIEFRAGGRQTLVAPSLHPDGGEYTWGTALEVATCAATDLERDVNMLATATLIARRLPEHRRLGGGGRHDYALSLAGFMLRNGRLDRETVLAILRGAWDAKRWPSDQDRREAHRDLERAVEDTARKLDQGKKVMGGGKLEEMEPGIAVRIADYWEWEVRIDSESEAPEERRNQADRLIGYAMENTRALFTDQHGAPHALVDGGPLPLNSRCYSWLRRQMWEHEKRAVNGEYLKTAAGTLAAHAEFSGDMIELHTRAAWHEGALYYELRPSQVVEVDATGWRFVDEAPVLFRRFPNLKPLPEPEGGGDLTRLWAYLNLRSERDRRLLLAYLATVPLPHIPRPILNVAGPMESGKTTLSRLVKRTLDPTAPESVRVDPRDLLQKAAHAYVLMFDNQSSFPDWAADTACRLVTGEADSKRRLYTDDEDVIVELKRAVLLNGINVPTDRGDVLDRSLVVELERIPDSERKTEEELWERFELEHPGLLGAVFDVLARAIALKAFLELPRRPRLADWAEYAAAVYEAMGWGAGTFLDDWSEVVKVQNLATLDGSPVAQTIIKFMEDKDEYAGTSSEVHSKLKVVAAQLGVDADRDKAWPKSARWLWRRIKEVLPLLVAAGIEASREHTDKGSTIALRKISKDDVSNVREEESGEQEAETADISAALTSASNVSDGSNVSIDVSPDSARTKGSDGADDADITDGDSSQDDLAGSLRNRLVNRQEIASAIIQLFRLHPETQEQTPAQIAEDLYIWTDLGYEPTIEAVAEAMKGGKV